MPIEQLINLAVIAGFVIFSLVKADFRKGDECSTIALGIALIGGQLMLNVIFAAESIGMAPPIRDVLLVKEISQGVVLAVIGYALVSTGIAVWVRGFFIGKDLIDDE